MPHLPVAVAPRTQPDRMTLQADITTWRIVAKRLSGVDGSSANRLVLGWGEQSGTDERAKRQLASRITAQVEQHGNASLPLRITVGTDDGRRILNVAGVAG